MLDHCVIFFNDYVEFKQNIKNEKKKFSDCVSKTKIMRAKAIIQDNSPSRIIAASNMLTGLNSSRSIQIESENKECAIDTRQTINLINTLEISRNKYRELVRFSKHNRIGMNLAAERDIRKYKEDLLQRELLIVNESSIRHELDTVIVSTLTSLFSILEGRNKDIIDQTKNYTFIFKIGMDGSHSNAQYKVVNDLDDSSYFFSMMVPLAITCDNETIWLNKKPSSTVLCRLLSLAVIFFI